MIIVISLFVALLTTCYGKIDFNDRARNFSVEILYFTAEETQWHTVISPFGIWSLLTAVSMGTTDYSREQLIKTLILPRKHQTLVDGYKSLTQSVLKTGTPNVALKSKNFLFIDGKYRIKTSFTQSMQKDFNAISTKLNFKPSNQAQLIANNVIKRTRVTSNDVLNADDFDDSKMILTNVISFKGLWLLPFNATDTKVESFYNEDNIEVGKVNMMFQEGMFMYSHIEEIQASALELPYGDNEISKYLFLILLPYRGQNVSSVYKSLEKTSIKNILIKLNSDQDSDGLASVMVSLPRFKISSNQVLNRPLSEMGITDIFDSSKASFKSLTTANDIFISAIVHKAEIEVTEFGTVASATTSAFFVDRMMPFNFKVNRPFIYFIVEKTTSTIIFSGVYSKPSLF
ncbi:serine protease inhibitor 77Ba-like [Battus philenor]|uniref:serine protease inhibitor 77Ba-like n=1 Tax=Battus philenor TaxID=42288 RepID=UPI0035CF484F